MNNSMRLKGQRINLEFALKEDIKTIHTLLIDPITSQYMFSEDFPPPSLEEFSQEPDWLYTGMTNKKGAYMLITHHDRPIGAMAYTLNKEEKSVYELDIWIGRKEYLGLGLGTESLKLLMTHLEETYKAKAFLMRPWNQNKPAIKTYSKLGFREVTRDELVNYYSDEDYMTYGPGDYGDQTANLVRRV